MRLIKTLALGAIGYGVYTSLRQRSRAALSAPGAKPEPVQRWEGEGGNVPAANPGLSTAGLPDEHLSPAASSLGQPRAGGATGL